MDIQQALNAIIQASIEYKTPLSITSSIVDDGFGFGIGVIGANGWKIFQLSEHRADEYVDVMQSAISEIKSRSVELQAA